MFGLGYSEIILILLLALLLFGGKKLPELARGLGKGLREFKNGMSNLKDDDDGPDVQEPDAPTPRRPGTGPSDKTGGDAG